MLRAAFWIMSFTRRLLSKQCDAFLIFPIGCLENLISNKRIKNLPIRATSKAIAGVQLKKTVIPHMVF